MRRRRLLAGFGAAALGAFRPAVAQTVRVPRIGVILNLPPSNPTVRVYWSAFVEQLAALGWTDGKNVVIDPRYTEGVPDRNLIAARELVAAQVDVILASGSQATEAALASTRSIPIVMTNVSHPVESRFVASLARPGGNVTGVTNQLSDIQAKHFQMLRAILPRLRRVGVIHSPANSGSALAFADMLGPARGMSMHLVALVVDDPQEVDAAFAHALREGVEALHVHPTSAIGASMKRIAPWAMEQRLGTISGFNGFTRAGLLLSYGADFAGVFAQAAKQVDRILRGAKPAEIPVVQPTRFETCVNLKTAKQLGITLPQSILLAASEVIE